MKFIIGLFLFLLCISISNAQVQDAEYAKATELYLAGKSLSAAALCETFVPMAKDSAELVKIYLKKAQYYTAAKANDKALVALNKSTNYLGAAPSSLMLAGHSLQYAVCHFSAGAYDQAATKAMEALQYAEKSEDQEQTLECYNQLGKIYLVQKNIDKAEGAFTKARNLAKGLNDDLLLASNDCFIGQVLFEKKEYEQALIKMKAALHVFEKKANKRGVFVTKGFLSKIYFFSGDINKATKYSFEVLPLLKDFEFEKGTQKLVSNTQKMAKLATRKDTNALKQANKLVKENIKITESNNAAVSIEQKKGLVTYLKTNIKESTETTLAVDSNLLNDAIRLNVEQDSLYKQALQNKMLDIETKYQTEKKEKENLQLKADKEVQAGQMKLLGGGIGALLLSLGIFTFYYRRNKKQKDKIEALQKELHHRIDNNLAIIDGFIDKSMEGVEDKAVLENLGELQSRVGSINEVHRLLYQDNDVTALNLNKYMHALASHVQNIYKRDQVKINISCAENLVIDTNKSVHFGLIVNEFLTNSYKYAFAGVQHPIIDLVIEQNAKGISLNIKDNGIGFEADSIHKNAYGTRIMELLANKLHASYSLSGNDGTVLHLQLNTA